MTQSITLIPSAWRMFCIRAYCTQTKPTKVIEADTLPVIGITAIRDGEDPRFAALCLDRQSPDGSGFWLTGESWHTDHLFELVACSWPPSEDKERLFEIQEPLRLQVLERLYESQEQVKTQRRAA